MSDELIEPFAAIEYFVNGFCDHSVNDGVMTCAGYRLQARKGEETLKIVVVRIAFPVRALEEAIASAREALAPLPEVMSPDLVSRPH